MSKRNRARRKKGVSLRPGDMGNTPRTEERLSYTPDGEDGVPFEDIYSSVVALYGFDPIREAEERRRLA